MDSKKSKKVTFVTVEGFVRVSKVIQVLGVITKMATSFNHLVILVDHSLDLTTVCLDDFKLKVWVKVKVMVKVKV